MKHKNYLMLKRYKLKSEKKKLKTPTIRNQTKVNSLKRINKKSKKAKWTRKWPLSKRQMERNSPIDALISLYELAQNQTPERSSSTQTSQTHNSIASGLKQDPSHLPSNLQPPLSALNRSKHLLSRPSAIDLQRHPLFLLSFHSSSNTLTHKNSYPSPTYLTGN